ncbi:hypothetical protein [Marinibactrum halimedae]|uniref:Uncharacterized protein n=1 Tax=Marinibactrum halimedae TaxID=1444977 RepID=A0AA37T8V0_9GAMM|nr:hypothetical protein [Marinibactrum halimedae]MCD9458871.1 hypothetical protein [Marinibactrum halimedae]GLS27721.1 hypothetical protein GCM10007877_34400 [Marinibactrum halimedae]
MKQFQHWKMKIATNEFVAVVLNEGGELEEMQPHHFVRRETQEKKLSAEAAYLQAFNDISTGSFDPDKF